MHYESTTPLPLWETKHFPKMASLFKNSFLMTILYYSWYQGNSKSKSTFSILLTEVKCIWNILSFLIWKELHYCSTLELDHQGLAFLKTFIAPNSIGLTKLHSRVWVPVEYMYLSFLLWSRAVIILPIFSQKNLGKF